MTDKEACAVAIKIEQDYARGTDLTTDQTVILLLWKYAKVMEWASKHPISAWIKRNV